MLRIQSRLRCECRTGDRSAKMPSIQACEQKADNEQWRYESVTNPAALLHRHKMSDPHCLQSVHSLVLDFVTALFDSFRRYSAPKVFDTYATLNAVHSKKNVSVQIHYLGPLHKGWADMMQPLLFFFLSFMKSGHEKSLVIFYFFVKFCIFYPKKGFRLLVSLIY